MLQVPKLLHVSHIFSELRQVWGCCIKKTEGGLIMRVKRFIEWVHELKIESEKIQTESESSGTSKVNRFGASLPESTGLAKHSRVFETSGLVSEQGLKQEGFKSLKRNSVEGLKFNHKYLKSVHHHSPTGQAKRVTMTYRKAGLSVCLYVICAVWIKIPLNLFLYRWRWCLFYLYPHFTLCLSINCHEGWHLMYK